MRKITSIYLCALLIFSTTFIVFDSTSKGDEVAPNFTLPKVGGGSFSLSELRGKVVVLDFMATWCGPCETEIGHLKTVKNRYSSSQMEIVSIDIDDSESDSLLSSYATEKGITWTIVRDTGDISSMPGYDVSTIPTILILDENGFIVFRSVVVTPSSDLVSEIDDLLGIGSNGDGDGTPGFELWIMFMAMVLAIVFISAYKRR